MTKKDKSEKSNGNKYLIMLAVAGIIGFSFAILMFIFERLEISPYIALITQPWMTEGEAVIIFCILIVLVIWVILIILSAIFGGNQREKERKEKAKNVRHEKTERMKKEAKNQGYLK